jgi:hypothetical protein
VEIGGGFGGRRRQARRSTIRPFIGVTGTVNVTVPRDRITETVAYQASGLNLVVNAIILWNTVYLSRSVRFVRDQGIEIPDHLLAQVAPIPWSHIGITGDYLWNEIDQSFECFRPLRTNRFNPKGFVFP